MWRKASLMCFPIAPFLETLVVIQKPLACGILSPQHVMGFLTEVSVRVKFILVPSPQKEVSATQCLAFLAF